MVSQLVSAEEVHKSWVEFRQEEFGRKVESTDLRESTMKSPEAGETMDDRSLVTIAQSVDPDRR